MKFELLGEYRATGRGEDEEADAEIRNTVVGFHNELKHKAEENFKEVARKYETEPLPVVKLAESKVRLAMLEKFAAHYQPGNVLPHPKIFYIESASWNAFQHEFNLTIGRDPNLANSDLGEFFGRYIYLLEHVYISYDSSELLLGIVARIAHELAHAYRDNKLLLSPRKDKKRKLPYESTYQGGMEMSGESYVSGVFLEEFYATETELQLAPSIAEDIQPGAGQLELKQLLSQIPDNAKEPALAKFTLPENLKYLTVAGSAGDNNVSFLIHGYTQLHKLGKRIVENVTSGQVLLEKARLSGNWSELSRSINEVYGPGAFRAIMKTGKDRDSIILLEAFLDSEGKKRKWFENIIDKRNQGLTPQLEP